jgi:hypothetical protein
MISIEILIWKSLSGALEAKRYFSMIPLLGNCLLEAQKHFQSGFQLKSLFGNCSLEVWGPRSISGDK